MSNRSNWEIVTSTELQETTDRLKIDDGWLYRTTKLATVADGANPRPAAIATALAFVPAPGSGAFVSRSLRNSAGLPLPT